MKNKRETKNTINPVYTQMYKSIRQQNNILNISVKKHSSFTSCSKFIENLYDSIKMHLFFLGH